MINEAGMVHSSGVSGIPSVIRWVTRERAVRHILLIGCSMTEWIIVNKVDKQN